MVEVKLPSWSGKGAPNLRVLHDLRLHGGKRGRVHVGGKMLGIVVLLGTFH